MPDFRGTPIGVTEVAKRLGRGQTYVKDHAHELGGVKVKGKWTFDPDRLVLCDQAS